MTVRSASAATAFLADSSGQLVVIPREFSKEVTLDVGAAKKRYDEAIADFNTPLLFCAGAPGTKINFNMRPCSVR